MKSFSRLDNMKLDENTYQIVKYKCEEYDETFENILALSSHWGVRIDKEYAHGSTEETCKTCSASVRTSAHFLFVEKPS